MQRKSFNSMQCPIARSLERVGEWWTILILRDAFYGMTRFDEFEKSLGISPNVLTRRLKGLVDEGLLERRQYSEKPPRFEYLLTDRGRDFMPVFFALMSWGNKHFAPEGTSVVLQDAKTGALIDPILVNRADGKPLTDTNWVFGAGPAARQSLQHRISAAAEKRSAQEGKAKPAARRARAGAEQ
jgi:DNA-binding HxlR family transcriptional regulator